MSHRLARAALTCLTAAAVLTACGSDDRVVTPLPGAPGDGAAPATAEPAPLPSFSVANGEVQGPDQLRFDEDSEVVFEVSSDTADEVHVHGYDRLVRVEPGTPATVRFPAEIPGIFEVELEQAGTKLTSLRIG